MLRRWGPRQCELTTCLVRNLLFQQLCGTESQRLIRKDQLLEPEAKDRPTHYGSPAPLPSSDFSWALGQLLITGLRIITITAHGLTARCTHRLCYTKCPCLCLKHLVRFFTALLRRSVEDVRLVRVVQIRDRIDHSDRRVKRIDVLGVVIPV